MTKEEDFFKENFPEYVTEKGEFLSPYWDLFSAGVICANFELKVKIEQLEQENAELDCQKNRNKSCYSCANATERCFKNEIGCPCQKYKSYTEENTELEKKISVLLSCKNCPENKGSYICQKEYEDKCLAQKTQYIKELQEENKKWKDEWQEQVQKENNESYARTLQTIQLNKAKKIIGNLYAICKDNHYPNTSVLMEQAEQFLKEIEK